MNIGTKPQNGDERPSRQKSDFLNLFWTLAENDRNVRMQAVMQLLDHLKNSAKQESEVQYALKRLVRGLASSRDAARQGFSTALSGLLAMFPKQIALQRTHELLRDAMEVHSSMKPMEQREHMFGRLFGLLALYRSGRLQMDVPLLVTIIKELLEMATFKRWFRETCYEAALTLLADVPTDQFVTELAALIQTCLQIQPLKSKEEESSGAWNADQVLLAVGVQRYMHVTKLDLDENKMQQLPANFAAIGALKRRHVHTLIRPMRGSSGSYPRVHSAWYGLFGHVLNSIEESTAIDLEFFEEMWTVLVENSLFGGNNAENSAPTSHERQGLALKLFELVAPKLPESTLYSILTPRLVRCLYHNSVAKRNYLHEAAHHCLKSFATTAPRMFHHFLREQFTSPLSVLVTSVAADSDDDEDQQPIKEQKRQNGGFETFIELEEKKEREEILARRTDRARVWAVESMVAALIDLMSSKVIADDASKNLQKKILRFLVFHAFFSVSKEAASKKKSKKAKRNDESEVDELAHEAAAVTPPVSDNVANYTKTRLFSLLSFGLAGAEGDRASVSVLSQIFALAQELHLNSSAVVLRIPLNKESSGQFDALVSHVDTLQSKEVQDTTMTTHRSLSETFLLLFMSSGLELLDAEQREDAMVVAADLEKCYTQLVGKKLLTGSTKKEANEAEQESVLVLTDLLLSLLSQDSSAMREIVTQVFRSLLPLLNRECLTTMINVLLSTREGNVEHEDEGDEFAPITEAEDVEQEQDVSLSSDALSDAVRKDEKLLALHGEDLALAAFVGQVKIRSQRKKDLKRARLQTMHFQLRVVDLLQVFASQRPEQSKSAIEKHDALVLSLVAPLFCVLTQVETADSKQLVLRDRIQAVLLHKVLRVKDKLPCSESAQMEALNALRQLVELFRTTPMDKDHSGKVASAAVVYLVRVVCTGKAEIEVLPIVHTAVFDAFTKKRSRFPRASFQDLLTKAPIVGARLLLEPLVAVAAATNNKENADVSVARTAVDEFSQFEVFRLLTLLLRGASKLPVSADMLNLINGVSDTLKSALVRRLAPDSVHHLKAKRLKIVLLFALQIVKFWRTLEDQRAHETDVRDVVAAVQAVNFKSPVIKNLIKHVSESADVPLVVRNGFETDKKEDEENELTRKAKPSKKKRKRSITLE
ncbi:hypothetical protein CCR75_000991 [Bremia lactucae]|uniref:Uncharacterized protein n=1 Tax=Bremia lactucae TaxID=4779 RepID=A0A976NY18_BRELC|nr:hypothetical protein CCR75_000991 [Bremia lactucae]